MTGTETFVLALRLFGLIISAHLFISIYVAVRLFPRRESRIAWIMFWMFSALALEAALTGIPVVFELRAPLPPGFTIGAIPALLWFRIAARLLLSGVTWWAALYLTGLVRSPGNRDA